LTSIKPAAFQTFAETRFCSEQENPGKRMFSILFLWKSDEAAIYKRKYV